MHRARGRTRRRRWPRSRGSLPTRLCWRPRARRTRRSGTRRSPRCNLQLKRCSTAIAITKVATRRWPRAACNDARRAVASLPGDTRSAAGGWGRTAEDGAVAGEDGGADAEAAVRAVGVLLGGERGARQLVERSLVDARRGLVRALGRGLCTHTWRELSGRCGGALSPHQSPARISISERNGTAVGGERVREKKRTEAHWRRRRRGKHSPELWGAACAAMRLSSAQVEGRCRLQFRRCVSRCCWAALWRLLVEGGGGADVLRSND